MSERGAGQSHPVLAYPDGIEYPRVYDPGGVVVGTPDVRVPIGTANPVFVMVIGKSAGLSPTGIFAMSVRDAVVG
jgi:hypothetical protein